MTGPVTNCPSCGAPVVFQSAAAVQTVCTTCKSVLVRHDLDLQKVGVESLPPPVTSRIRVGTTGSYKWARFTVVGRIAYEWASGAWSEWHLDFADGRSGWLSDAQDEYAVTFAQPDAGALPSSGQLKPGTAVTLGAAGRWTVGVVTRARYAGTEGELPFATWERADATFVDLRSEDGRLATLDYADGAPVLYTGEFVSLESLGLRELADPVETRVQGAATLNCPHCGGTVTLRRPGESVNAVCEYCQSVLDVRNSRQLQVLQRFDDRRKVPPRIPLGARGQMHGAEWEVLGFQQRTIAVEGTEYSWREYLLHNPDRGFRYLSEYGGHWNDIAVLTGVPRHRSGVRPTAEWEGRSFRHFQRAYAVTTFVLGEFPWQVRAGDKAQVDDFIDPPLLLSREKTGHEVSWSLGEYVAPEQIYQAFGITDRPPRPQGVFANQPGPAGAGRMWTMALIFAFLVTAGWMVRAGTASRGILSEAGTFTPGVSATADGWSPVDSAASAVAAAAESAASALSGSAQAAGGPAAGGAARPDSASPDSRPLVSQPFELTGRTTNLHVMINALVDNSWAAFGVLLVPEGGSGDAREFSTDVSYYHGVDQGESWSEGSRSGRIRIAAVPAGRYRLVVAPDGEHAFSYRVQVRRDVPAASLFIITLILLLIPPIFPTLARASFEGQRWAESDYAADSADEEE